MIKSSLDWQLTRKQLVAQMQQLPYNSDLHRMLYNIDAMITDLSRAEVEARRQKRSLDKLPELAKANDAIKTIEQWLMMAVFMK